MRILFLLLLTAFSSLSYTTAQNCACKEIFETVTSLVEANYAGYPDKVLINHNEADYKRYTDEMRISAENCQFDSACCIQTLRCWRGYFKDRSLHIYTASSQKMQERFEEWYDTVQTDFEWRLIDSQTVYLRMSMMKPAFADSMNWWVGHIQKNYPQAIYWILDVREGNMGSQKIWHPLKPALYTNMVLTDGARLRTSKDNFELFKDKKFKKKIPWTYKRQMKYELSESLRRKDHYFGPMNAKRETFPKVLGTPRKVAIFINNQSVGETERFLLWAKQSKKVILIGQKTYGNSDYSLSRPTDIPCVGWSVRIPVLRSNRVADGRGLNQVGIQPDFVTDPNTTDWIKYAQKKLREKK